MSDTPRIIPNKVSSSCQEMWGELRHLSEIFIPYMEATQIYGEAGSEMHCGNLFITMGEQSTLDTIDSLSWSTPDSGRVALLYTDSQIVARGMIPLALAPSVALERFFFSPREIDSIIFNPIDDGPEHFSYGVKRFYLPRLIGMLRSDEPWDGDAIAHAKKAADFYAQDRIFEALHHSALARELGAPVDAYFFTEIQSLISCSLWENVQQYLRWYETKEASSPRLEILRARLLSVGGQPDKARDCLVKLIEDKQFAASVSLEIGRAYLIEKKPELALEAFDKCLSVAPTSWDAQLGRGIAIRSMHYQSGDSAKLLEAKKSFEAVVAMGGLHSAEAYHHCGTICGRLLMLDEAVDYYRQALAARYSSVSRMNLALMLKQMGDWDEAVKEFQLLDSLDKKSADNIRAQFAGNENITEIPVGKPSRPEPESKPLSPLMQTEQFAKQSLAAYEQIKEWKIPLQGDLMDFRRLDEFFSLFAPQGRFSEQCVFHGLPDSDVGPVLLTMGQHLAGLLVRRGHARWSMNGKDDTFGASVIFKDNAVLTQPFNFFVQTIRRFEAGANQDNLTSLEFMIAHLPDYGNLSRVYISPWKKERASAALIAQWDSEAKWVATALSKCGFNLTREMSDLQMIDDAIDLCFTEPGVLSQEELVKRSVGDDARRLTFALGMHLGFIVQKFTEGAWLNHPNGSGICIDECLLTPVYPVRKIEERIQALGGELTLVGIATLVSPLACAHLARKIQKHEIETREELKRLLRSAIPSLMEDDPSGSAVERMTSLIEAQAGELGTLR